ncbi:hypothetical protein C3R44_22780, partial [Mycobacterium tuberculosis]
SHDGHRGGASEGADRPDAREARRKEDRGDDGPADKSEEGSRTRERNGRATADRGRGRSGGGHGADAEGAEPRRRRRRRERGERTRGHNKGADGAQRRE